MFRQIEKGLLLGSTLAGLSAFPALASTDSALKALGQGDNATALNLFREAAGGGDAHAEVMLGQLLLNGKAGVQDPAEAATWFRKAADSGKKGDEYVAMAEFNLGALYFAGRGVPKDVDQAVKFYTRAAEHGFAQAQTTLLGMYFQGNGVPADNVQALKWALVAAAGGSPDMVRNVATLHQRMSDVEFAKGKAAALKQFPHLNIEDVTTKALAMAGTMPRRLPDDPQLAALPPDARAQHYLDTHDYLRLKQVTDDWVRGADRQHALEWLKAKVLSGETIGLAYIDASYLWQFGNADPANAALKDAAATMTTYAFAVIEIDGQTCKDASAPSHNLELNLSNWARVTWSYMAALPLEQRAKIERDAVDLESRTAPLRKVDRYVCGGGIAQFQHEDLSKGREVPTPPGHIGKTIEVETDPNYIPELKPEAEYKPLQSKARAQLNVAIAMIIEKLRDQQSVAPGKNGQ